MPKSSASSHRSTGPEKVSRLIPSWYDSKTFDIDIRRLKHRQAYFDIQPDDYRAFSEIHQIIDPMIDEIVDVFYAQIGNFNNLNRIINNHSSPAKLKKTFRRFVLEMGVNVDTAEYAESRLKVGIVHARIGLNPHWYLGAYSNLMNIISDILEDACGDDHKEFLRFNKALSKIIMFESALGIDAYHLNTVTKLNDSLDQAKKTEKILQETARTDGLTGVLNKKAFMEEVQRELDRSHRYGHTMALLFIDFDHFKSLNDTQGHQLGDHVLQESIKTIRKTVRTSDIVGRYGGEEFVIGLVECTPKDALVTAERIGRNIASNMIQKRRTGVIVPVTVSIGLHVPTTEQKKASTALRNADRALYAAKAAGRNRVCISELTKTA